MALYYDAVNVLSQPDQNGSLKSRIFNKDTNYSRPAQLYALIRETAKYDVFLKEVIEHAGILNHEPKLTPLLSLLLVHDHFFAKGGIATAVNHPLRQAVENHKARIQAEFTKARLRRKCATVEALKAKLREGKSDNAQAKPRWARINSLRMNDGDSLSDVFPDHRQGNSISDVLKDSTLTTFYIDKTIQNLLAFHPAQDLTKIPAYSSGLIILQDKASCFPAYLLLGNESKSGIGDVLDACAAPGNKTTHLAALMQTIGANGKVYACERDPVRSSTLRAMVSKAGADHRVVVWKKQDFLAINPYDSRYGNVTHLLLDPSCSGSGILGREDIPQLTLPEDVRRGNGSSSANKDIGRFKKRKRASSTVIVKQPESKQPDGPDEEQPFVDTSTSKERLVKLSNLQTRIVEHAMKFPSAKRITYSTCSIHEEENEQVASRVLHSQIAKNRRWRLLRRDEQVDGLRKWPHRGAALKNSMQDEVPELSFEELESCLRCYPEDDEGTMGFFVCGFTRDGDGDDKQHGQHMKNISQTQATSGSEDEAWEGFDDS